MAANQRTTNILREYRNALSDSLCTGVATEHTHRPALKALIESLGRGTVFAVNEPSQVACGAPDFIIQRDGVPLGHVECKDIGVDLDAAAESEQIERYRNGLPNLILTDYLEFRWYVEGKLRGSTRLGRLNERGEVALDAEGGKQAAVMIASFFEVYLPTITNAGDLVRRMAAKASLLRSAISQALDQGRVPGTLDDLLEAYRKVLIDDLSPDDFADMQAQTIAYGLFAARCNHNHNRAPEPFTRQSAVFIHTTPFLSDVFGRIAGPDIDSQIEWIVDDLARLLDRADMIAVLKAFGQLSKQTAKKDPVVHFYEDFLAAYDPDMREMRGVYYTPEPVVSYIVRSIDALLRRSFSLKDGLADIQQIMVDVGGKKKKIHRVLILDPAAGTGTFLREVVANIRQNIIDQGMEGAWTAYVKQHLLPRLFGFELLMAAYAMCHLNLTLEIADDDTPQLPAQPQQGRLNIFLTNSLDQPRNTTGDQRLALGFAREIAREAARADDVKRDKPVMVILGNPPYSGHSANKGEWISSLLRGDDGESETGSYFHIDGEPLGERNPKWLNDDYVKFIRFAQWRIERTGEGILGFVTNHSYLDNPTFRGMRRCLMDDFDEIYLLDLHGNAKKRERTPNGGKDENVFDIQQGVAIGLFAKHGKSPKDTPARVFHADLWGERGGDDDDGKYGWLAANDITSTNWTQLQPRAPLYLFVPRDEELADEYEKGWPVPNIFPVNSTGIVTARDEMAIQWTADDIQKVALDFTDRSEGDVREIYGELVKDKPDWNLPGAQRDVRSHQPIDEYITRILYRPFDPRYTYYTGRGGGFICGARGGVMRHMLAGKNLGLITCRQQSQANAEWSLCGVSRSIIESCATSNKTREINSLFPLYVYPAEEQGETLELDSGDEQDSDRKPNLSDDFVQAAGAALGLEFVPGGTGDLSHSFGPEDVFHYVYAILHSPEYRRRYADFLKSDFPRIPLCSDRDLFAALVEHGRRLASLHLMESEGEDDISFRIRGSNRIDKVSYTPPMDGQPGRVYVNRYQYFDGVAPETWEFTVGGYRPCEKWLNDRKGHNINHDDIAHYSRLTAALAETTRIMPRIDAEIDSHDGWPIQ